MGRKCSNQRRSTQTWGERSNCIQKEAPGSKPRTSLLWGDSSLIWVWIIWIWFKYKHINGTSSFPFEKNISCRFVSFWCVYISTLLVFLFMNACLERALLAWHKSVSSEVTDGSLGTGLLEWSLHALMVKYQILLKFLRKGQTPCRGRQTSLLHWSYSRSNQ